MYHISVRISVIVYVTYTLGAPCRIGGLVQSGSRWAVPPGMSTFIFLAAAAAIELARGAGGGVAVAEGAGDARVEGAGEGIIASSYSSSHSSREISSPPDLRELDESKG